MNWCTAWFGAYLAGKEIGVGGEMKLVALERACHQLGVLGELVIGHWRVLFWRNSYSLFL